MAITLEVCCGLDPEKIVRFLGGENTGARRNVKHMLSSVASVVSNNNYSQIKSILTQDEAF